MILLLSGGIDSVAIWRLLDLPNAVNFNIGTAPMSRENDSLAWASRHFKRDYLCRPLFMNREKPNGWLPFRNSLLVLAAAQIDTTVILGAVAEWAPDKNFRWARRLEQAVNEKAQPLRRQSNCALRCRLRSFPKGNCYMSTTRTLVRRKLNFCSITLGRAIRIVSDPACCAAVAANGLRPITNTLNLPVCPDRPKRQHAGTFR